MRPVKILTTSLSITALLLAQSASSQERPDFFFYVGMKARVHESYLAALLNHPNEKRASAIAVDEPAVALQIANALTSDDSDGQEAIKELVKQGHLIALPSETQLTLVQLNSEQSYQRAISQTMQDPEASMNRYLITSGPYKGQQWYILPNFVFPLIPDNLEKGYACYPDDGFYYPKKKYAPVPGAFDEADLQAYIDALDEGNDAKARRLLNSERVVLIPRNSPILALSQDSYTAKRVRVTSGKTHDKTVWIPLYCAWLSAGRAAPQSTSPGKRRTPRR